MALFSALQKFITKDGQPVEGASVIVKLAGSATPATLYATRDGGTKSNPFLTDAAGNALCYVSPGRYDMTVTANAEQVTFNDVEVGPVSQVGSFTDGVTLTDHDQWVRDSDGTLWEYTGSTTNFPLQVAPGSAPDNNFRVVVPNGGRQFSSIDSLRNARARFNGEVVFLNGEQWNFVAEVLPDDGKSAISAPNGTWLLSNVSPVEGPFDLEDQWGENTNGPLIRREQYTTKPLDIFVDAAAADGGTGLSMDSPVNTLAKAMSLVPRNLYHKTRVFLRDGLYVGRENTLVVMNLYVSTRGNQAGFRIIGHAPENPWYSDLDPSGVVIGQASADDSDIFSRVQLGVWQCDPDDTYIQGVTIDGWAQNYGRFGFYDCRFVRGRTGIEGEPRRTIDGHGGVTKLVRCHFEDTQWCVDAKDQANVFMNECTGTGITRVFRAARGGIVMTRFCDSLYAAATEDSTADPSAIGKADGMFVGANNYSFGRTVGDPWQSWADDGSPIFKSGVQVKQEVVPSNPPDGQARYFYNSNNGSVQVVAVFNGERKVLTLSQFERQLGRRLHWGNIGELANAGEYDNQVLMVRESTSSIPFFVRWAPTSTATVDNRTVWQATDVAVGRWLRLDEKNVTSVSSVDELRLTAGWFDGQQISLSGYYAGSTKGGGVFVWDAASTAADDGGVTIAVTGVATGRWVRQLDGFVTTHMFGAVPDFNGITGTDNYEPFMAAIRFGGKIVNPKGSYLYSRALQFRNSGVEFVCETPDTLMFCKPVGGVHDRFPEYGSVLLGTYITGNLNQIERVSCEPTSENATSIAISNSADLSKFSVGDCVFITSTNRYEIGVSAEDRPQWGELNIIQSISGSNLVMKYKIGESGGCEVANLSNNNYNYHYSDGFDSGTPNFIARDVKIIGGTWETDKPQAPFSAAGGAINCVVDVHEVRCRNGVGYGNLYAYCEFKCKTETPRSSSTELAYCSHDNVVTVINSNISNNFVLSETQAHVWINESAKKNNVNIGSLKIGAKSANAGVRFNTCRDNIVNIGSLTGVSVVEAIIDFSDIPYSGARPNTDSNLANVNETNLDCPIAVRFVGAGQNNLNSASVSSKGETPTAIFHNNAEFPSVNNSHFSSGNVIRSASTVSSRQGLDLFNTYVQGGLAIGGDADAELIGNFKTMSSARSKLLEKVNYSILRRSITSAAAYSKVSVLPAGAFGPFDKIHFRAVYFIQPDAGGINKNFKLIFGSTNAVNFDTNAQNSVVKIDVEMYYDSNAVVICNRVISVNDTVTQASLVNVTGLDLAVQSYDITHSVTLNTGAETSQLRVAELTTTSANAGQI